MVSKKSKIIIMLTGIAIMIYIVAYIKIKDIKKKIMWYQWSFHTNPDNWESPRIFQRPLTSSSYHWDETISVKKIDKLEIIPKEKHLSPNSCYWYSSNFSKKGTFQITVYNEHNYIVIDSGGGNRRMEKIEWVNEKLLYIRDWLGRVLAIDIIYDVENEKILYIEETNDGSLAFQQWQQGKQIKQQNP